MHLTEDSDLTAPAAVAVRACECVFASVFLIKSDRSS